MVVAWVRGISPADDFDATGPICPIGLICPMRRSIPTKSSEPPPLPAGSITGPCAGDSVWTGWDRPCGSSWAGPEYQAGECLGIEGLRRPLPASAPTAWVAFARAQAYEKG